MHEITYLQPRSAFKVGILLYGILTLVALVIMFLVTFIMALVNGQTAASFTPPLFLLLSPLFYALLGALLLVVTALIYNLIAAKFGGLKIKINKA